MGRPLTLLACDNCIPGDASVLYLPLSLGVAVALVLALGCVWLATTRDGVRSIAATVAAIALVIGPVGGVVALASDVGTGNSVCGSALSASLLRGVPNDAALDEGQTECKERGEKTVRGASVWAVTAAVCAGVLVAASSLPPRRRAAFA